MSLSSISILHYLMEQYEPKPLKEIFKFSHILTILAYYGRLLEWKVLMESICNDSRKTWKDNLQAFFKLEENRKRRIVLIKYKPEKSKSLIYNFEFNSMFIRYYYIDEIWLEIFTSKIRELWVNDKIVLVSPFNPFTDHSLNKYIDRK